MVLGIFAALAEFERELIREMSCCLQTKSLACNFFPAMEGPLVERLFRLSKNVKFSDLTRGNRTIFIERGRELLITLPEQEEE